MTSKAIPESEILAPRDPSLDHRSDDWPEFELKDVRVHLPEDPSQLASLLEAAAHYPLTVTGYLEPLSNAQAHLQLPATTQRRPLIEISEVRMFSYGQFEDGNIGLWAGGKAGWFALKPARAYRSIWTGMVESVNTLYWVADAYREKRKRGDWKTAPLLPDYTPEELIQKYAEEVIEDSHGAKEAAQVIHEQKDFLLASMLAGKEGIAWLKNPLYIYLSQRFPEEHALIRGRLTGPPVPARGARQTSVTSQNSNLKRKRGRPRKHQSEEVSSVRESSVAELPAKEAARSKTEASHQESARPHGARRTRRGRTESSEAETPEVEVSTPSIAHSDDDDMPQRSMKGRSALRPKASKASKGASKGGKAPVMNFLDDDDEDDNESSPVAAKRRNSRSGGRSYLPNRSSKLDVDEGIDIPSSPSGSDHQSPLSDTGAGANEEGMSSDLALRLKHEPDPIQEDTWVCALDGCSHKVYQASAEDSQRLIREHYALHAYDDDARVQLVKKLQHPSLPVGHLMERVRLQARTEGFPSSSSALEGANAHSRYRPLPQVRY